MARPLLLLFQTRVVLIDQQSMLQKNAELRRRFPSLLTPPKFGQSRRNKVIISATGMTPKPPIRTPMTVQTIDTLIAYTRDATQSHRLNGRERKKMPVPPQPRLCRKIKSRRQIGNPITISVTAINAIHGSTYAPTQAPPTKSSAIPTSQRIPNRIVPAAERNFLMP